MKRLVPLWITAVAGFVLIVAYFIPMTQGWGEITAPTVAEYIRLSEKWFGWWDQSEYGSIPTPVELPVI